VAKILMIVSSARAITLASGKPHPTGYWAEEVAKPLRHFKAAAAEVQIYTPDGQPPRADLYSLEPKFHHPDADRDFLASVMRSFATDPEDVRITLEHLTELNLIAARRVHQALVDADMARPVATALVQRAARQAWRTRTDFVSALNAEPAATDRLDPGRLQALVAEVDAVCVRRAGEMAAELGAHSGLQNPKALASLTEAQLQHFDAVFIPGGHGPMVDMTNNSEVARVIRHFHARRQPVAALCHAPAALLSVGEDQEGRWLFDGYRMTAFLDEEEEQTIIGKAGPPWWLETDLKNAGGVFDPAPAWSSHVVIDRNLLTAQNPGSSEAMADALLKKLEGVAA